MSKGPVLLVEYDPLERRLLAQGLRRAGYEVQEASHPADVSESMGGKIKLLTTHLHFHDAQGNRDYQTGAEFCKRVRGWTGTNVPIIGLSSIPVDEEFQQVLNRFGFPLDLYPFDIDFNSPSRLVELVQEVLREAPAHAS